MDVINEIKWSLKFWIIPTIEIISKDIPRKLPTRPVVIEGDVDRGTAVYQRSVVGIRGRFGLKLPNTACSRPAFGITFFQNCLRKNPIF